jgi:hypothetical protein
MRLHDPKNGMKLNKHLSIGGRLDSSRFSGQMSMHNRGIAKKTSPCAYRKWFQLTKLRRKINQMEIEDITDMLLKRLTDKEVLPDEVPWLVRDVLNVVGTIEETSVSTINQRLATLGWDLDILDEFTLVLIMSLIDGCNELSFKHHS